MAAVRTILQGSRNIDQMRVEISQFISMLIGMVDYRQRRVFLGTDICSSKQIGGEMVEVEDGECFWKIEVLKENKDLRVWFVLGGKQVYIFEGQWTNPRYVELVYSQLPKLLKTFTLAFPGLAERLEPFIKAAYVEF